MEKSAEALNEYIKAVVGETITDILNKEYPELKDNANNQKEMNLRLENLEKRLYGSKFTDKIQINGRCEGNVKYRSFGVYQNILDEFMEFSKGQRFTLIELISEALLRFMISSKNSK